MLLGMAGNFGDLLKSLEAEATPLLGFRPRMSGRPDVRRRSYAAGATIADWDEKRQAILLIASGWVASGKALTNGARTVVDFSLSGDIITIGSTQWAREVITAVSPVTTFELPGPTFESLLNYPRPVSEAILKGMARRYARVVEHVVSIGRRGAMERTAHLLLELGHRVDARKKDGAVRFSCPLTQADLGDALGLSAVHVNRVLKELRESGFVSFRGGVVEFHDRQGLIEFAGFDPSFLALQSD